MIILKFWDIYLVPSFLHSHELEISTTRKFDPILDYPGGLEEKD